MNKNITDISIFNLPDPIKALSYAIIFTITLSSVALLNGFPLVFSDSGTYLLFSVKGGAPLDRPVFYSWIIAIFSLNTKLPSFSIVASQALMTSIVLLITLSCLKFNKLKLLLILIIFLTISTSLPWFVGQIMPDFFLGIGLLSAYTLIYHYDSLNNSKRIYLYAIFFSTGLVHYSNAPILLSTLFLFLILKTIYKTDDESIHKSAVRHTAILILLTLTTLTTNHFYTKYHSHESPTAHFLMNRLTDDGIIQKLLNEHCANEDYILCPYKDNVKGSYLWSGKSSPFRLIGGFQSPTEESWEMILDSLQHYPLDNFLSATNVTMKQLFNFHTGDGLKAYNQNMAINNIIKSLYTSEYIDFTSSKQQQGVLIELLSFIKPIHIIVVGISALILLVSLIYRKYLSHSTIFLVIFILLALICNAAICGIFSGAYDRYQSRIIWLVPFVAAILFLQVYDTHASVKGSITNKSSNTKK